MKKKKSKQCFQLGTSMAHAYQEDLDLRPCWANSSQDPIFKITTAKGTGDVAQVVECLLCKYEDLNSNSG
jgi:hypothetical protein